MKKKFLKQLLLSFMLLVAFSAFAFPAGAAGTACNGCTRGTFNGSSACLKEGNLHICDKNFPDLNFKLTVSALEPDNNLLLTEDFVLSITKLTVKGASSLRGIAYFTNLKSLTLENCSLYILVLPEQIQLTSLICDSCHISMLQLPYQKQLTYLSCNNNSLSELALSTIPNLTYLSCNNNRLKRLALTHQTKLQTLFCDDNNLPDLNLSNQAELLSLSCERNQLTDLDLSANRKLQSLAIDGNQITQLDLSNVPGLKELNIGQQSFKTNIPLIKTGDVARFDCTAVVGTSHLNEVQKVTISDIPVPYDPETGIAQYSHYGISVDLFRSIPCVSPFLEEVPLLKIHLNIVCLHNWQDNNPCKSEIHCSICGEPTVRSPQHTWVDSTCRTPATCAICGTSGGPYGEHDWSYATCTAPMTCKNCGKTNGNPNRHQWVSNNYHAKRCRICNATAPIESVTPSSKPSVKDYTLSDSIFFCTLYLILVGYLIRKYGCHQAPVLFTPTHTDYEVDIHCIQSYHIPFIYVFRKNSSREFTLYRRTVRRKEY